VAEYDQEASSSIYTAFAFDAAWLSVYAAAWSFYQHGGIQGEGMGQGMRVVSNNGGDESRDIDIRATTWNDARAYFESGLSIDVSGASGSLDYDPETEETTSAMDVWFINAAGTDFLVDYTVEP
jgi:hypothetical protein